MTLSLELNRSGDEGEGEDKGEMIAITAALDVELKPLCARANARPVEPRSPILWGQLADCPVVLVRTGIGRRGVEAILDRWLRVHRPAALISTGFAGALQERLEPGELVLLEQVILAAEAGDGAATITSDRELIEVADRILSRKGWRYHRGMGLTADHVVQPWEKRALGRHSTAWSVDMESYWAGRAVQAWGVPFLAVRIVLDRLDTRIPPLVDGQGRIRPIAVLALLSRPWRLGESVQLGHYARRGARTLTSFLETFLQELHAGSEVGNREWQ